MAELGDFLVSSEDALKDIQAEQLDFAYVEQCEDVEIMRGIVTVLRSGKEGSYPELLQKAEDKLLSLLPATERERTMRLRQAATVKDISIAENEIFQWEKQVAQTDENLRNQDALRKMALDDDTTSAASAVPERKVYPVRGSAPVVKPPAPPSSAQGNNGLLNAVDTTKRRGNGHEDEASRNARIARRQRRETEYKRLINNRKSVTTGKVNKKSTNENTSVTYIAESSLFSDYDSLEAMPELERRYKGEREKTKGNEHFKAGEHIDAFLCYTRSIILDDTNPAAYSNRAIVNLKLNKLELAESDCNSALSLEGHIVSYEDEPEFKKKGKASTSASAASVLPKSAVKMVSRRGMARFRLGKYKDAIEDFYAAYLATSAAAATSDSNATSELEQLLKKAQDKYEEVEGRPYVLIRHRAKLPAAQAKAVAKADAATAAAVEVTINRMSPSSSYLFTFDGEDRECFKAPPKVDRGFAGALESKPKVPKVYDWTVSVEGVLNGVTVKSSSGGGSGAGMSSPGGHFTRISISMSDDESEEDEDEKEEEGNDQTAAAVVTGEGSSSGGFSRITITESDTEGEEEEEAAFSSSQGTRIVIEEDSDSEPEPEPVRPTDAEFLAFKEEGNKFMKAKQYAAAIEAYSKCIQTDPAKQAWNSHPSFVASLNNRAAVYLELREFDKCYADCAMALVHEPSNVKAFYRRASAYEKHAQSEGLTVSERVNLLELGLKDAASILSIERSNKQGGVLHKRLADLVADARAARDAAAGREEAREEEQAAVRENVKSPTKTTSEAGATADNITATAPWVLDIEMKKQQVKSLLSNEGVNLSGSARTVNLEQTVDILSNCLDTVRANGHGESFAVELELSLCHLLIATYRSLGKKNEEIVSVCTRAIDLDSRNVKAYLRRAQANVALNRKSQANVDLKHILKLDPYNNEVLGLLDELSEDADAASFDNTTAPEVSSSVDTGAVKTPVTSPTKSSPITPAPVFSPPVTSTTPMTPMTPAGRYDVTQSSPMPMPVTPASSVAAASLLSPGTPGVSSSTECLRLKELGNQATAAKKYQEAIKLYTQSIEADAGHLPSWSNRSQAYLKLSLWDNVIDDCTHVMECLPTERSARSPSENSLLIKVCYRRALAYKGKYVPKMIYTRQFLPQAMADIKILLELDPTSKPAQQEKDSIAALLASSNVAAEKNHPRYADKTESLKASAESPMAPAPAASAGGGVEGLSARSTTVRKTPAPSASVPSTPSTPSMSDIISSTSVTPNISTNSKNKSKDKKDVAGVSNTHAALRAAANIASDIKPSSVPTAPPATVVEFERHWKLLRSKPDLFIHQYMLKVFKKSTYKKVIKTSISDDLLSYVYKNTYEQCVLLAPQDPPGVVELSNSAYTILKGMTANSEHFSMIVSVLSSQDLEYITLIIAELEGHAARGAEGLSYSSDNVQALKTAYNL